MYSDSGRCLFMYCMCRFCYGYVCHQCTVTVRYNHWLLQCVAVCCSVLYMYNVHISGTVRYNHFVLQCVAVYCSVLYTYNVHVSGTVRYNQCVLQCVAVCCIRTLYICQALCDTSVAVCCSVLYTYHVHISDTVRYNHCVLQCVAVCCICTMYTYQALCNTSIVCCSVLQCVVYVKCTYIRHCDAYRWNIYTQNTANTLTDHSSTHPPTQRWRMHEESRTTNCHSSDPHTLAVGSTPGNPVFGDFPRFSRNQMPQKSDVARSDI